MKRYGQSVIVSTDQGICITNLQDSSTIKLTKTNGLYSNRVLDFELVDHFLWMVFSEGIQRIDLSKLRVNKITPKIYLEQIQVNENTIDFEHYNNFSYNENKVQFKFVGLAFKHRGELIYNYRLKGYEEEWNSTDFESNSVKYAALPPGNYTFEVKAINENGVPSSTNTYSFIISPPFWTRWWFFVICGLVIIGLIAIYFQIQNFHHSKKISTREKKSKLLK